jgi:hypothetical protein
VWVLPWQIVASFPALAVGVFWIVRILLSEVEAVQGETAEAVKVNVTVPALISAAPGVYTGVSELVELKVPVPEVVHKTLDWFVAVPVKVCVLPWQIVASFPALAVGVFLIIRILVSDVEAVQGETAEAVKVNVTVPALISAVPGV